MTPQLALEYAARHRATSLDELKQLIRFQSVSAQPRYAPQVRACARWLAGKLRHAGLDRVRIIKTRGHPLVRAQWLRNPGYPTVLLYGHYDVQPVEPEVEWVSPPFEPVIRGGYIHGRGSSDDKGQLLTHVQAMQAWLRTAGTLPVNIQCLFEGEEEIGSPHLRDYITEHRDELAADVALMSDTRMRDSGQPAITYSERGSLNLELEVRGADRDLHSGTFGGVAPNSIEALCRIIAGFHASDGSRIEIPGAYRRVRTWSARERQTMALDGPTDEQILEEAGAERARGEHGYSNYERTTLRPALTVNGITGGYQGEGTKGIIPAKALAKIGFRLVPDQDPREVERLFRSYIRQVTPAGVRVRVRALSSARPILMNPKGPYIRAARFAYRQAFGTEPVLLRSGGTIPVLSLFDELLGIPTVLMGFALPGDRMHAPNERFHLPNYFAGTRASIWFLAAARRLHRRPCGSAARDGLARLPVR